MAFPHMCGRKFVRIFELEHRRVAIWGFGKEGQAVYQAIRAELPELRLTILCTEADAEIVESMNDPRVVCTIHVDEEVLNHLSVNHFP